MWKETFVSDATLVGVVKELRRVLDDHSPDRPIIRTAHRVGYAFCRPVNGSKPARPGLAHWVLVDQRRIMLQPGENLIGRDPASTVCLDSADVSRRHACIIIDGRGVRLQDLGSKNGTKIGDRTVVGESSLQDGDAIDIGPSRLVYRTSAVGATTGIAQPDWRGPAFDLKAEPSWLPPAESLLTGRHRNRQPVLRRRQRAERVGGVGARRIRGEIEIEHRPPPSSTAPAKRMR